MLSFSSKQVVHLQTRHNDDWVSKHVVALTHLAPEFAVLYAPEEFRMLVVRMLCRADLQGLRVQDATLAFCFASIKLGIGFESEPNHPWFGDVLRTPPDLQANSIWDGLSLALEQQEIMKP